VTFGGRLAFVLWIYPAVLCQTMFFASVVNVVLELSEVMVTLDPKNTYEFFSVSGHRTTLTVEILVAHCRGHSWDRTAAIWTQRKWLPPRGRYEYSLSILAAGSDGVRHPQRGLESIPVWYYVDDDHREQGPYTNALMQSWLVAGYLHPDLHVRKEEAGNEGDTRHVVERQRQQGHQHGHLNFSFHWRPKHAGSAAHHPPAAAGAAEVDPEVGRCSRSEVYAILGTLLQGGKTPFQPKPPPGLRQRGVARTEVLEMSGVTPRYSEEINRVSKRSASLRLTSGYRCHKQLPPISLQILDEWQQHASNTFIRLECCNKQGEEHS
jgi:hypothetical protein